MSSRIANSFSKKAKKARARARRARVIYIVAIGAVMLLIAAFVLQSWWGGARAPVLAAQIQTPQQVGSDRVSFSGIDQNGSPFALDAATAAQDEKVPTLIHLNNARGALKRVTGENIKLSAKLAHYDLASKSLHAEGGATIEQPGTYKVILKSAQMNLDAHSLTSNEAVVIKLPGAIFAANSFEMGQDGKRFILRGKVKATIETNIGDLGSEKWRRVK